METSPSPVTRVLSPVIEAGGDRFSSAFLAVALFIPMSVAVVTYRHLRLDYSVTQWIITLTLAMVLVGTIAGWLSNFPRWSYPYTAFALFFFLVYAIGRDSEESAWENFTFKALILGPVLLIFLVTWLFVRQSHPLGRWCENIRGDWTIFPFFIYSLLAIVINGVLTDIRSVYGLPFLIASALLAIVGGISYILIPNSSKRTLVLAVSATLVWLILAVGSATFWHDRPLRSGIGLGNGYQIAAQYTGYWAIMLGLMLLPVAFRWVRKFSRKI